MPAQNAAPNFFNRNLAMKKTFALSLFIFAMGLLAAQPAEKNLPPDFPQFDFRPSARPDRILLACAEDPATAQTVIWRTDTSIREAYAEIARADPSPEFDEYERKFRAETKVLLNDFAVAAYHQATFTGLQPGALYAYRVGSGPYWSEWIQFRTAEAAFQPFSFIYMGDAQNDLYSHWARAIRAAYCRAPGAGFILHAGDLINHSQNDYEWGEWFEAGSFIHRSIPSIATPGNHEYIKDTLGNKIGLSPFWNAQFQFPDNGPPGLEGQCYYIDYQGARIISLNSNQDYEVQAEWLEKVLAGNPNRWAFVTFHHPVRSTSKDRQHQTVLSLWKPILDKHRVDLVLQGHDHAYGRGQNLETSPDSSDASSGTAYVVSVSGAKMYPLAEQPWMSRAAENTQLYQVVEVFMDHLIYRSYTTGGEVYDAFILLKRPGRPNEILPLPTDIQEERRFINTLVGPDER